MKNRMFQLLFGIGLLSICLAGCGGGGDDEAETAAGQASIGTTEQSTEQTTDQATGAVERTPVASTTGGNALQAAAGSIEYHSPEGGFYAIWPPGCSGIRLRTFPLDESMGPDDPTNVARAKVFCDRAGREAEGCAVSVHFLSRMEGRPEATPERVIDAIKGVMEGFKVDILRQSPIERGPLEGIGLHCLPVAEDDDGAVWIEGFAYNGDLYILTAWSASRIVFDLLEFQTFFASFLPDGAGFYTSPASSGASR